MTWKAAVAVMLCALVGTSAWAQGPARQITMGTKIAPAMNVVYVERESTVNQLLQAFSEAGTDLGKQAEAAGFHLLGNVVLAVRMDAEPQPEQLIKWECWLPIADKPVPEDLDAAAAVKVKSVPEEHVAFTYHVAQGSPETTFFDLYMWALGQGLQLSGEVRSVVTFLPPKEGDKEPRIVIEAQVVIL